MSDDWNRQRRGTDNISIWAGLFYKYGVPSGIATFLVWALVQMVAQRMQAQETRLDRMQEILNNHVIHSTFYQSAMCRNLAILAGRPLGECEVALVPVLSPTDRSIPPR